MIFLFKKAFISLLSAIAEGAKFCGGLLFSPISSLSGVIKAVDYFTLRHIGAPLYKLIWRANRRISEATGIGETDNRFSLFAYYLVLFLFVVMGVFLSWASIIKAQSGNDIFEDKPLVFVVGVGFNEEELILESHRNGSDFANTGSDTYFNSMPVLGYSDNPPGIPIDCEECEEFEKLPTRIDDSTLIPPAITSLESGKKGETIRREIAGYVVKGGDTLTSIAKNFGLNVNTILWANNLYYWNIIKPGQTLLIPPTDGVLHKVVKGDTLAGIAKKYKADVIQILAYNDVDEEETLKVGEQLMVPGGKKTTTAYYTPYSTSQTVTAYQYSGALGLIWPVSTKRITQYYNWRHHAIDIGAPNGSPIYVIADGVVEYAGWGTGYGWQIIVNHGGGMKSRYAHCSWMYVKKGNQVAGGQRIANIGSSGWSTGPHLHIEIYINGARVNPLTYLK